MINTVAPWFGSNRTLAEAAGEELAGHPWVGVVFAGGMTELRFIKARTILVNDRHADIINLARVVADPERRPILIERLTTKLFHPRELREAQDRCRIGSDGGLFAAETLDDRDPIDRAVDYFVCVWMGRSGTAGTDNEFDGGLAIRWNAGGGDSAVRYRNAVAGLDAWASILAACTFAEMDAFDFLDRVIDEPAKKEGERPAAVYCDPPFPDAGDAYRWKFTEADHRRLAARLGRYEHVRVVCRFHDHPLIRDLYPASRWTWRRLKGRDQHNQEKPEVLILNGPSYAQ